MARLLRKIALVAAFSFMFLFISVGYAAISSNLTISGSAVLAEPIAVYIKSVEVYDQSSYVTDATQDKVFPTNLQTNVSLSNRWTSKTITYKITVKNNTKYKYAYSGVVYDASVENNSYLKNGNITITTKDKATDKSATFNGSDSIDAGTEKVFYATYTYASTLRNVDLSTFVNYEFGVHVDSMGDMAIERTLERFRVILNTEDTYQKLITDIDDKYKGQDWQANYIGNVSTTVSAGNQSQSEKNDIATIENLFQEDLSLTINGVQTNVTVMIKRTNVDENLNTGDNYTATYGNSTTYGYGCEMSIYLTSDKLNVSNGRADVYLAVFTCETDSEGNPIEWYQIGEVYEGKAPIVSYDGTGGGTGSFITDDWTSNAKTYKVTDNYSYTIPQGDGRNDGIEDIREIIPQKDAAANNELLRLLRLGHGLINGDYSSETLAGHAVVILKDAMADAEKYYTTTTDINGNPTAASIINDPTRAQLIPIIKKLDYAVSAFDSYLP